MRRVEAAAGSNRPSKRQSRLSARAERDAAARRGPETEDASVRGARGRRGRGCLRCQWRVRLIVRRPNRVHRWRPAASGSPLFPGRICPRAHGSGPAWNLLNHLNRADAESARGGTGCAREHPPRSGRGHERARRLEPGDDVGYGPGVHRDPARQPQQVRVRRRQRAVSARPGPLFVGPLSDRLRLHHRDTGRGRRSPRRARPRAGTDVSRAA